MIKKIVILIISIAIALSILYYIVMTYESIKTYKKWYYSEFYYKAINGKITSINYYQVYPKRPVISVDEFDDTKYIVLSCYCEENLELNKFISIDDSVIKPTNSNHFTFLKKGGEKFEFEFEYCPDWI